MLNKPDHDCLGGIVIATAVLVLAAGAGLGTVGARSQPQDGKPLEPAAPGAPETAPDTVVPPIRSLVPEVSLGSPRFESAEGVNTETGERVTMRFMKLTVHNRAPLGIRVIHFGWGASGQRARADKAESPDVIEPFGEREFTFNADGFEPGDVLELRAVVFANGTTSGSKATIRSDSPEAIADVRAKPPLDPRCPHGGAYANGRCRTPSAILIDLSGDGVSMTDVEGGVLFDMSGDGTVDRTAWIAAGSDDAWLCLDRNENGTIDDATELFGAMTRQPAAPDVTGFMALTALDTNRDGKITRVDGAFADLRLWTDMNHDGVSQPGELKPLTMTGVVEIRLDDEEHQVFDANDNCQRLRAIVGVEPKGRSSVLAWEVLPTMDYGWIPVEGTRR